MPAALRARSVPALEPAPRGRTRQDDGARGHRSLFDVAHRPADHPRGGDLMLPRCLDPSGVTMGVTAGVEQNGTQTGGGVYQNRSGGCPTPPIVFSPSLFGFFVLDRTTRTAPAERERTGATPPLSPLARHGQVGGALPSSCIRAGRLPGPRAGRTTSSDAAAGSC